MSEVPEEELAAEALEVAADDPDPEEFEADERETVSPETGTVYDPTGEPEVTPQDELPDEDV